MKKGILSILILLINYSLNAQISETKYGIKSGINLSKYTPEIRIGNVTLADYKTILGFYIGGYINVSISNKLKIQPELLFSTQGTRRVFGDINVVNVNGTPIGNGDFETKITEYIISVPLNLQYLITSNFSLDGGVQLGYIINREEKNINTTPIDFIDEIPLSDFDKFDFGLNIGLGYQLSKKLRINTKYFFELIERDEAIKPSVISFGIEYEL